MSSHKRSSKMSSYRSRKRSHHKSHKRSTKISSHKISSYNKSEKRIDQPTRINKDRFHPRFRTKLVKDDPYILKLSHLLNRKEIKAIIKMAYDKGFEKSTIVVDGQLTQSTTRTSETAYLTDDGHKYTYDKYIESVLKKICYLMSCDRSKIESLMVVKYGEGKEYYNHWDFFEPADESFRNDGGQRIATFFVYLNDLDGKDHGGETEFPRIGVKVTPRKGTGIFWWNEREGKVIRDTMHRGNPVKGKGNIKYGLNIWIRKDGW